MAAVKSLPFWVLAISGVARADAAEELARASEVKPGFSFYGAQGLGQGLLAGTVGTDVAFLPSVAPAMTANVGYGLSDRVNLLVTFRWLLGGFEQPGIAAKITLLGGADSTFDAALQLGAAYAFFAMPEFAEDQGPRWATGERDVSATVLAILSWHRSHDAYRWYGASEVPLFLVFGVEPNLDLSPVPSPLGGPPPPFTFGTNALVRMGSEMRLSSTANLFCAWGIDVHLRPGDWAVTPLLLVGLELAADVSPPPAE